MKQLLSVMFIVIMNGSAYAQNMSAGANAGNGAAATENISPGIKQDALFDAATMSINSKVVCFQNLPANCKVVAYLTNTDGELLKNKKLTPDNNSVDMSRLPRGLYYVTLISKKHRRSFMINL